MLEVPVWLFLIFAAVYVTYKEYAKYVEKCAKARALETVGWACLGVALVSGVMYYEDRINHVNNRVNDVMFNQPLPRVCPMDMPFYAPATQVRKSRRHGRRNRRVKVNKLNAQNLDNLGDSAETLDEVVVNDEQLKEIFNKMVAPAGAASPAVEPKTVV